MSDERGIEQLLEERPELADAVETVLSVDESEETWTFDDVPLDSGTFGELVSHDIVDDAPDGNYYVEDRSALRAALDGDDISESKPTFDVSAPSVDRRTIGQVLGVLAVVAAARLISFTAVYRGEYIVLSGNDPYFYRYWVERFAAEGGGLLGIASGVGRQGSLAGDEPLLVTTLSWVSSLLGGGTEVTGHVMAWYPVVAGVVTAALLYVITVKVTADRRVGLAAVLILAFLPGHALRTSLGFADHHAFDYIWLVVTALGLVMLLRSEHDWESLKHRRTIGATLLMGIGMAGQVLAWNSAILLVAPVGLVALGATTIAIANAESPLPSMVPLIVGGAVGTLLVVAAHVAFGWMGAPIIVAVAAIALGTGAVAGLGELWHRFGFDARLYPVVNLVLAIVGLAVVRFALPTVWGHFAERSERLFLSSDIAEAMSLFSFESFGFIFLLGFTLVLTLPTMVWATARLGDGDRRWLVPVTYGWWTLFLASLQVRFVGEFAAFASLFAGLGFVWLAAWV
ncbi:MAG: STT3 domain-containing protein, partial [Haloarculaceae archaeon]